VKNKVAWGFNGPWCTVLQFDVGLHMFLCVVFRGAGRSNPQQNQSHRKDGACVPGTPVSTSTVVVVVVVVVVIVEVVERTARYLRSAL